MPELPLMLSTEDSKVVSIDDIDNFNDFRVTKHKQNDVSGQHGMVPT